MEGRWDLFDLTNLGWTCWADPSSSSRGDPTRIRHLELWTPVAEPDVRAILAQLTIDDRQPTLVTPEDARKYRNERPRVGRNKQRRQHKAAAGAVTPSPPPQ